MNVNPLHKHKQKHLHALLTKLKFSGSSIAAVKDWNNNGPKSNLGPSDRRYYIKIIVTMFKTFYWYGILHVLCVDFSFKVKHINAEKRIFASVS